MEPFLEEKEASRVNYKIYIAGSLIGIVLIGLVFWLVTGPSMQEQMASILEGSYREGSPEFEQITKDIIIATGDNTVESPNAFGTISMFIQGNIRNKGNRVINGLEVNVAVVNQFNEVIKEKRVLVVPTQQERLMPGETIPITLSLDGFNKKDDRANIRWKVTAIRTEG
jgi:hypothetical protein